MKKIYSTPQVKVMELDAVTPILAGADSTQHTPGFGTDIQSGVKIQFGSEIEFDDMKGVDIVKRNPWDSQW